MTDQRLIALKKGLQQLSSAQLQKILDNRNQMVFDGMNYDETTGFW